MRAMAGKAKYHHGSLRAALIAAALEMLEAEGLSQLSLRRVAGKIGVSHAAPAHHFPTFGHLLTALAAVGFERFDAAMKKARTRAARDPAAQMRAGQKGYLDFALAHPALFRLMFNATLLDWTDADLMAASCPPREQLREICAPAAAKHGLKNESQLLELEHLVWSQIHGRAHLLIDRKFAETDRDSEHGKRGASLDLAALLFR
jgi:AcrR family transcriptional regulator